MKLVAKWIASACALLCLPCGMFAGEVDFQREVLPVLSGTCYACHGPDEETREADLRLDVREAAVDAGAIVPGDAEKSELISRIFSDDEDLRMPPASSGVTLTQAQKEAFEAWIESGAEYQKHWAFEKPVRPAVPAVTKEGWNENPIDAFVLSKLYEKGVKPSPEADRYSLVRRVYLDLIGLPPTPEQADAFVKDNSANAYEKLVDELLASPQYGERWARAWLDLARYADTNGYEKDRARTIWPYRDWVIKSLNADLPFDQFTIEQISGDLLEDPTQDQIVATGFHRNTMLNEEGGIDPLEFRFYAMVDRVATTGAVWLGMTTGCAQCHTHKYDPITHTDYYQLLALLNNCEELELDVESDEERARKEKLKDEIAEMIPQLKEKYPAPEGDGPEEERRRIAFESRFTEWKTKTADSLNHWIVIRPSAMSSNLPFLELQDDGSVFASGDFTKRDVYNLDFDLPKLDRPITGIRIEAIPDERLPMKGPGRTFYEGRGGQFFLSEVVTKANGQVVAYNQESAHGKALSDGDGSSGLQPAGHEIGERIQYTIPFAEPVKSEGKLSIEMLFERHFVAALGRFRISVTTDESVKTPVPLEQAVEEILHRDSSTWSDADQSVVLNTFLLSCEELAEARKPIDQKKGAINSRTRTLIFQPRPEGNPRVTHRHHRGEFLSPREVVEPAIPELFLSMTEKPPRDRLEFARWLVCDDNPLVARVVVNRAWMAFFGRGLVVTPEDFGTQSEPPSHPELLDWLACELMTPTTAGMKPWSMKGLHRLIVTSATYKQESKVDEAGLAVDPLNEWLGRGPSYRLPAEVVRDEMLAASGLLSKKMYGPSVYPPQPESVVSDAYGGFKWRTSTGEDRYRRSLYTFSKRTAPFAAYTVFDAPTGENCTVKRGRSNTPLQALTLLNDEMYLEMARHVAAISVDDVSDDVIATRLFRRFLVRPPRPDEVDALVNYYTAQKARFDSGELAAAKLMNLEKADARVASWMLVARVIMNLDEAIVKP